MAGSARQVQVETSATLDLHSPAALIARFGELLGGEAKALTDALREELVSRIPELRADPDLLRAMSRTICIHLEAVGLTFRQELNTTQIDTSPAVDYAELMAQREVPLTVLLKAYRIGQQAMTQWSSGQVAGLSTNPRDAYDALRQILDTSFRYLDRVTEESVRAYECERERWGSRGGAWVRDEKVVAQLLAGDLHDRVAAEAAIGYRFHPSHVGMIAWVPSAERSSGALAQIERICALIAQESGARETLFYPRDRFSGNAWFSLPPSGGPLRTEWTTMARRVVSASADTQVRIALGTPKRGLDGFKATHAEARATHQVMLSTDCGPSIASYADGDTRTVALLTSDVPGTRTLVASALGGLAGDSAATERLRETLRAYLETQNFKAAGAALNLHPNTIRYRVERALTVRGRPLEEGRLELELALIACRWMGAAVLAPKSAS